MSPKDKILSDAVPSELSEKAFTSLLSQEAARQRILNVVKDYVDSVTFMEVVRKYAGMEIDHRLFKSWGFWITTIASAGISSLIGAGVVAWLK